MWSPGTLLVFPEGEDYVILDDVQRYRMLLDMGMARASRAGRIGQSRPDEFVDFLDR